MPSKISALEVSSVAAIGVRWRASLRSQGKSPRTILSYQAAVDALAAFLNRQGMPEIISSVRREHVEAFIAARQEETTVRGTLRSLTSVGIEFRSLRVFFGYALEEGEIKASPMAKMKPPKPAEMIIPLIDDAAMKKLLKVTEGATFEARRDHAILLLLIDTGLRRAEIAGLTVDAVNLTGRPFVTVIGKGRKQRSARFGPGTAVALQRYIRIRSGHQAAGLPQLWLGMAGPMTGSGIYQVVVDRARQAGIGKLHTHQFRHTHAHLHLHGGGQEGDLMIQMGWTTSAMVRRYGRSGAAERAADAYQSPVERLLGR